MDDSSRKNIRKGPSLTIPYSSSLRRHLAYILMIACMCVWYFLVSVLYRTFLPSTSDDSMYHTPWQHTVAETEWKRVLSCALHSTISNYEKRGKEIQQTISFFGNGHVPSVGVFTIHGRRHRSTLSCGRYVLVDETSVEILSPDDRTCKHPYKNRILLLLKYYFFVPIDKVIDKKISLSTLLTFFSIEETWLLRKNWL